ncbi:MAG: DUF2922 domain-containing protein [Dialister sp.]|nr:DUF2922 domain-containing protein [Dialister sp.]
MSRPATFEMFILTERKKCYEKLNLVFNTSGKAMTVSLTDPKEGLTLEECRTAAEKLQVVFSPSSGETVTGFEKATVVTTTTEEVK